MSFETVQDVGAAPSGNASRAHPPNSNSILPPGPLNSHSVVLEHADQAVARAAYQKGIMSPSTLRPPPKESQQSGVDSPAVEESAQARLERLGKQRPEVFESIWAEIGFVFSISMSQVLSVSRKSSNRNTRS